MYCFRKRVHHSRYLMSVAGHRTGSNPIIWTQCCSLDKTCSVKIWWNKYFMSGYQESQSGVQQEEMLYYCFKRHSCTGQLNRVVPAACWTSEACRWGEGCCGAGKAWLGPAPPPPIGSKSHAAHSVQPTIDNLLLTLQRRHEQEPSRVGAGAAGMIN